MSSSALVLSVTPELIVGIYLLGFSFADSATPPAGIAAFGQLLISSVRAQTAVANAQLADTNPFIIAISLIVFLCLLFYIGIIQTYQPQNIFAIKSEPLARPAPRFHYQLIIIFGGVLITILWMVLTAGIFSEDSLFILSLPAIIISGVLWGITRKGK
jgi:hypothetical protein